MILQNNTETKLQPAILPFHCSSSLPAEPGKYICDIHAKQGDVRFRHAAYNIFTGCFEDKPDGNDAECVLIREGETVRIAFTCAEHYGHADDLSIFNDSYLKPAVFTCSCQKQ